MMMKDGVGASGGLELSVLGEYAPGPVDEELAAPRRVLRCRRALNRWNVTSKHLGVAVLVAIGVGVAVARSRSGGSGAPSAGKEAKPRRAPLEFADMPPLSDLVDRQSGKIVGPVDRLLDFGIVGFPRCGTTSIRNWIKHKDPNVVIVLPINGLARGNAAKFAAQMYHKLKNSVKHLSISGVRSGPGEDRTVPLSDIQKGMKNQGLLLKREGPVVLSQGFNNTKLVVSLRHPIPWFQSAYNQMLNSKRYDTTSSRRVLRPRPKPVPSPRDLINCDKVFGPALCGNKAEFHRFLAVLHKTPLGAEERRALRPYTCRDKTADCGVSDRGVFKPAPFNGTVFLLELSQLRATRDEVRTALGDYLGMELPDMNPLAKMGLVQSNRAIYICDDKYRDVREVLLQRAVRASRWIIDYFIMSPDVTVPAREYFVRTLEGWKNDPCDSREGRKLMELHEAYA